MQALASGVVSSDDLCYDLDCCVPRPQNLRFQGQYLEQETGLRYNTFRYYDPGVGRFINQDPIRLAGGSNLYAYAPNPVRRIDPWDGRRGCRASIYSDNGLYRAGEGQNAIVKIKMQGYRVLDDTQAFNASSRRWARSLGNSTDDAGHIRGSQLGGSGGKRYVFPQDPHTKRGDFQVFEGRVVDYVPKTNRSVDVEQTFNYGNGGTPPPVSITRFPIRDARCSNVSFLTLEGIKQWMSGNWKARELYSLASCRRCMNGRSRPSICIDQRMAAQKRTGRWRKLN